MARPRIGARRLGTGAGPSRSPGDEASMSAGMGPGPGWLLFRRIVDVPFETCVAALEQWQRTGDDGGLHLGESILCGPLEHNRGTGTCQIQARLARGPLRPPLPMRLNIDRWSASATAVELIPSRRVTPTAAYFRAGHRLIDALARWPWPAKTARSGAPPIGSKTVTCRDTVSAPQHTGCSHGPTRRPAPTDMPETSQQGHAIPP